jgi:hypothetical protein
VNAPIVFAGYAIEEGKNDYTSFDKKEDFTGKVVMVLRYEPLDADGRSQWSDRRFSGASAMRSKLDAVADRKAVAIILVNPPECRDGAKELEQTESSVFGPGYDIPIVQLSPEAADALLRKADPNGRGLMDFRQMADKGEVKCVALKPDVQTRIEVAIAEKGIPAQNVGGVLRGKGKLADEWMIIGGHYDHVGMGYFGADPQNRGKLHPGADDNASGTGAMLCSARAMRVARLQPLTAFVRASAYASQRRSVRRTSRRRRRSARRRRLLMRASQKRRAPSTARPTCCSCTVSSRITIRTIVGRSRSRSSPRS